METKKLNFTESGVAFSMDDMGPSLQTKIWSAKPKKPNEVPQPGRNPETEPSEEPEPAIWPQKEPEIKPEKEPLTVPPAAPPDVPEPPKSVN